jgi:hypothetical protein
MIEESAVMVYFLTARSINVDNLGEQAIKRLQLLFDAARVREGDQAQAQILKRWKEWWIFDDRTPSDSG